MGASLESILVFADGASSGNPGPGGWGAIVASPNGVVQELGGRENPVTNNQMELKAVLFALSSPLIRQSPDTPIAVHTDSTYVIYGITKWVWGWRNRNWTTAEGKPVANAEIWKALFSEVAKRRGTGKVEWHYVRGHAGIPGNERVDEIAVQFSQGKRPELYSGPLLNYSVAIHDIPEDTTPPEPKLRDKSAPKAQPHCYLSLVDGVLMRHSSWKECEGRIKGRPHAKFKKAMTPEEESKILSEWGVK